MSDDLPQGWAEVPLDSVVYFQEGPGLRKWQFGESGIPFLNIRTFDNGRINRAKCQFVKLEEFKGKYEHFLLNEGDLVVSSSGTIGKVATIQAEDLPLMLNTSTIRFRARHPETLVQDFLRLYVQSQHFFRQIDSAKTGSAIFNYGPSHLKQMSIVVAPLAEQRRIVAKLEVLLGKVDASQQRLAKIPVLLKRFRQSVLAAACSGRLTADWRDERDIEDEWPVEPLSELFTMRNGKSLIATKRQGGDVPVYGGNGYMGTHNEANADGLVIVIGRVGAQCGNVHYVTGKVWVTDNAISLQGKRELVPAFYAFFLRSLNLNQLSAGTGQPYVSQEILGSIETPVVSLPEQQEIVRRVEGLFALADQLEVRLAKARGQVDKLTPSLLARAFAGQLVPQDPTDEPAEKLLERIQTEKR